MPRPRRLTLSALAVLSALGFGACTFEALGLGDSGPTASDSAATTTTTTTPTDPTLDPTETDSATTSGGGSGSGTSLDPTAATDPGSTTDTSGSTTTTGLGTTTDAPPSCGDGSLDRGEECDNGDLNGPGQACKADCALNVCGDNDKGPGEGCDNGNTVDGDDCSSTCALESCGNKDLDPGEECDDGNQVDNDACTNACTLPTCGDKIVQAGEDCDGGVETAMCNSDCTPAKCGDMKVNTAAGEECDDGNSSDLDACTNACEKAACGDGFLQPGEECDDGDLMSGDGCSDACKSEHLRVFVSSAIYRGDLGGLVGADEKCDDLAAAAGIGGAWMAWLSSNNSGPAARFTTKGGALPYQLLNGTKIADNWADLVDGDLDAPINRTEENAAPVAPDAVWTNTQGDGTPSSTDKTCVNWTNSGGGNTGDHGDRTVADSNWTKKGSHACNTDSHIYCFEQ